MSLNLLKGGREGAVAAEATFVSQLLGGEVAQGGNGYLIETLELGNAQSVDIGVIGDVLLCEILAEVGTVGTNLLSEL